MFVDFYNFCSERKAGFRDLRYLVDHKDRTGPGNVHFVFNFDLQIEALTFKFGRYNLVFQYRYVHVQDFRYFLVVARE